MTGNSLQRLILANESLRVEIIPAMGGKIASIQALPEKEELLQQPLRPFGPRTRDMAFDQGDASGYDECVPSVSGCEVHGPAGSITIPDHGDFWRLPFNVIGADESHATLEATGFSLPLRFQKTIHLSGDLLQLSYELENVGRESIHYVWSAHPGFAVQAGDRVLLPPSLHEVAVEWSADGRLGPQGTRLGWPRASTASNGFTDLSLVGTGDEPVGDKLFALAPAEGWCALQREKIGRRIEMRFDPKQARYLGLWLSYVGWPGNQTVKQFCVALEPCTAPTDSLAVAMEKSWATPLGPRATDRWQVEVRVTANHSGSGE
jgi:galactose mutarotase-like enzyme